MPHSPIPHPLVCVLAQKQTHKIIIISINVAEKVITQGPSESPSNTSPNHLPRHPNHILSTPSRHSPTAQVPADRSPLGLVYPASFHAGQEQPLPFSGQHLPAEALLSLPGGAGALMAGNRLRQ